MKRLLCFLFIVALLPGCATQVVDAWIVRADRGLENAADNTREIMGRMRDNADAERLVGFDKLLDVLKAANAAKKLDDTAFKGYETRLQAWLEITDKRRDDLDVAEARALGNLKEVAKCLKGIAAAAKAFGTKEDVNRRLDRIEDLVRAAVTSRSK